MRMSLTHLLSNCFREVAFRSTVCKQWPDDFQQIPVILLSWVMSKTVLKNTFFRAPVGAQLGPIPFFSEPFSRVFFNSALDSNLMTKVRNTAVLHQKGNSSHSSTASCCSLAWFFCLGRYFYSEGNKNMSTPTYLPFFHIASRQFRMAHHEESGSVHIAPVAPPATKYHEPSNFCIRWQSLSFPACVENGLSHCRVFFCCAICQHVCFTDRDVALG